MDCVRGFGSDVASRFVGVVVASSSGAEHVRGGAVGRRSSRREEVSDLEQAQGNEVAVAWMKTPFFDRVTVRKAWASIERVMCVYQPVY